jgi:16S rRNA (cytosine1402-N4)-methyltransferase
MSSDDPQKPRRRLRYRGRNPRHFSEKYKEQAPARYPEDVEKVLARGQTPAGTHRPVMVAEVLEVLNPQPGEFAVDCTLGFGGHAVALLTAIQPGGHLLGLDVDSLELLKTETRLRGLGFGSEVFSVRRMNYAGLANILEHPADIILADLGVSSMQIDDPARGFTFKYDGPLDLRMNPLRGQPASALLATLNESSLAKLLLENADEPEADRIAHAVSGEKIATTVQLAEVVRRTGASDDAVRRVFQALRIAVNEEFSALETFLRSLPLCLKPGGRAAILAFHSGEDRRVKKAFQSGEREGIYESVAREVVRPSAQERRDNPRCTSAKLRWAIRGGRKRGIGE